eukprot:TRINITY_DN3791_c0_g2_i1.p1 TRINITY_DN3791_c0_g2~~TRINITY_DN3791_c0_g2_i1.p1  ORF type:complete len:215 (-),score=65.10 TRINITY_DN3791_c0_g2_i1:397-1041(-)
MVSDKEISQRLFQILKGANLEAVSMKSIRQQLEKEFSEDLSLKKALIKEQIAMFLEEKERESKQEEEEAEEEEDEEEDESDDDDCPPPSKSRKRSADAGVKRGGKGGKSTPKEKEKGEKKKRAGGGGGLNAVCQLSEPLADLVGLTQAPRTQVVKKMWEYIREHNLQDPTNKRRILCDSALKNLFKVEATDMFKMNQLLSKHIWKIEGDVRGKE